MGKEEHFLYCDDCQGSGSIECPYCDGTGEIENPDYEEENDDE